MSDGFRKFIGYDEFGQFYSTVREDDGMTIGRIICDVRGKVCPICNQQWQENPDSINDQFFWRSHEKWAHETCFVRYLALQDFDLFYDSLCKANIRFEKLNPIKNGYYSDRSVWGRLRPWYSVQPLDYPCTIELGRRKRVFQIKVISNCMNPNAFSSLFADEDVTKEFSNEIPVMIHAWSEEDLREYLMVIAGAMSFPGTIIV